MSEIDEGYVESESMPAVTSSEEHNLHRRTVEAVDRLSDDEFESQHPYVHDSDYIVKAGEPFRDRPYRRAQADLGKVRQELRYANYLSVPKGGQTIFTKNRRPRYIKIILIAVVGLAALILLAFLAWELLDLLT